MQVSKDTDTWYEGVDFMNVSAVYIILLTF
jgi:hypothetical protein